MLKAKYFKHISFIEAKLGSSPLFVWRSILWGRPVLHKGLRWKIRNGRQVPIFRSNWILNFEFSKNVNQPELSTDAMMVDFINERNQLKADMIPQHFSKEVAERILRTLLPRTPRQDMSVRQFDKCGYYSIKNGYHLAIKFKLPENPSCSDNTKT